MAVSSKQIKLMCQNCEWETAHKLRPVEGSNEGFGEYVWACIFCGGESEYEEGGPDTELMMVPLATVGDDWSDPDELEVIWREGNNLR